MAATLPKNEQLLAYLRGQGSEQERNEIEMALAKDPVLRREFEMLQALYHASSGNRPDPTDWEPLHNSIMASWREDQQESHTGSVTQAARPALLAVFSMAIIAALVWFISPFATPPPLEIKLPDNLAFNTGTDTSTGLTAKISLSSKEPGTYLTVGRVKRGLAQAGEEIRTTKDHVLGIAFDDRADLILQPDSVMKFREFKGQVIPYLVRGSLSCDVQHNPDKPFTIVASRVRLVDKGTKFLVKSEVTHVGSIEVIEGSVLVQRPGSDMLVAAGHRASWMPGRRETVIQPAIIDNRTFNRLHTLPNPEPPKPPQIQKKSPITPKPKQQHRQIDDREATSWSELRESLSQPERDAISRFYKTVEAQMTGGQSMRALENLQNYISEYPGALSEKARYLLGECYLNLGQKDEALHAFRAYLKRHPRGTWVEVAQAQFSRLMQEKKNP